MQTILVVENDRVLRDVIELYLSELGHVCRTVGTYADAKAAVLAQDWDLLVTDVHLAPGARAEGVHLARLVRRRSAATRLVIMSGSSGRELLAKVNGLGAVFLRKPFELRHLLEACFLAEAESGLA